MSGSDTVPTVVRGILLIGAAASAAAVAYRLRGDGRPPLDPTIANVPSTRMPVRAETMPAHTQQPGRQPQEQAAEGRGPDEGRGPSGGATS